MISSLLCAISPSTEEFSGGKGLAKQRPGLTCRVK